MFNNGRRARAEIDESTAAANEIIAAPSVGHIEIDHISIVPTGGANALIFSDGVSQITALDLDDNQSWVFDNASGDYPITLSEATAFNITSGSATQVSGMVLYRVVGEA